MLKEEGVAAASGNKLIDKASIDLGQPFRHRPRLGQPKGADLKRRGGGEDGRKASGGGIVFGARSGQEKAARGFCAADHRRDHLASLRAGPMHVLNDHEQGFLRPPRRQHLGQRLRLTGKAGGGVERGQKGCILRRGHGAKKVAGVDVKVRPFREVVWPVKRLREALGRVTTLFHAEIEKSG